MSTPNREECRCLVCGGDHCESCMTTNQSSNEMQISEEEKYILSGGDKHYLCGGDSCTSGDKHCNQPTIARKDFALGHVRGNISLICCFIAQSLNRRGIQGLGEKIKPFHKCPCGSGKKMKKCMKKT